MGGGGGGGLEGRSERGCKWGIDVRDDHKLEGKLLGFPF